MLKKTDTKVNASVSITNKIPYLQCYEEAGMIKIENNKYSVTYKISAPNAANDRYVNTIAYKAMNDILSSLEGFSYRFTIRNSWVPQKDYLDEIQLPEDKEPAVNEMIRDYNELLEENISIGHNNCRSNLYLTIVAEADVSDDALARFEELDPVLTEKFSLLYGFVANRLSLSERLEVLYEIYHPDVDSPEFGAKVDYDGSGFSIESMKRMHMTTKDVIAPKFYEAKERDYMQIGDKYVRMFFVNSIPSRISDTLLSDLLSVSSNAILSVSYQPMNADFGFAAAARLVKENTEVKNVAIRETIEDRKTRRVERKEVLKEESEDTYFHQSALKLFMDSSSKGQSPMLTTILIGLYSDTLDELNRDASLLKISANKYAVQIKVCDFQQEKSFVSALPLGSLSVNFARTFDAERLSTILPMNIHSLFEQKSTLVGLHEITDNFLLVDRTNYPIGLIAGMKRSGKTFAMKREIANVLMSTNDSVVILPSASKIMRNPETKEIFYQRNTEYDQFVKSFNAEVYEPLYTDLFTCDPDYGLTSSNQTFKAMFLESFMCLRSGFYKKKYTTEEKDQIYNVIRKEAEGLSQFSDYAEAVNYASEHATEYRIFLKSIEGYVPTSAYPDYTSGSRVKIAQYNTPVELLLQLDYIWNMSIAMKKANRNLWIFVDGIDEFLFSPMTSDYFCSLIDKCTKLKVPFTMTISDAAKIYANNVSKIEVDYVLSKCAYFKFMSLGVIERKEIVNKMNISNSLVPYLTERDAGQGVVITPSISAPFNDHFEMQNAFYKRFV